MTIKVILSVESGIYLHKEEMMYAIKKSKTCNYKHCNPETYGGMSFIAIYILIIMALIVVTLGYLIIS